MTRPQIIDSPAARLWTKRSGKSNYRRVAEMQ